MDKGKVKVWYDGKTDILYVSFKEGASVDSEELSKGIRVEYGREGDVVGLEIHNLTEMVAKSLVEQVKEVMKS